MSITANDYITIACSLEKADVLQLDADAELVKMESDLADTRTTELRRNALSEEIGALRARIADFRNNTYPPLVEAVRRLQFHVTKYHGSVNTFLSANAVTVSPYFAAVSLKAGYAIDPANVGTSCG